MEPDNLQPQNPQDQVEVEDTTLGDALRRVLADEGGEDLQPETPEPELEAEGEEQGEQARAEPETEKPADAPAEMIDFETEDGQKLKVPKALEAYLLRQSDYSKKTAETAREREAVQQLKVVNEQAYAVVQQMGPVLAEFHQAKGKMEQYNQVDWDALYDSDPILHNKLKLEARDNLDKLQHLGQTLQQAPRMLEQVQAQAIRTEAARNYPIAKQLVPDFESRRDELAAVGQKYGYSEEEIRNVPDARAILILAHLADYQRIISGRQQVKQQIASAPPVVKPGPKNAPSGASNSNAQAAIRKLRQDSSNDSFVDALRAQRKQKGG